MYLQQGKLAAIKFRTKQMFKWISTLFCRSKIQGIGLYAARDLENDTIIIEYIGEIIRSVLSDVREQIYEAQVIVL